MILLSEFGEEQRAIVFNNFHGVFISAVLVTSLLMVNSLIYMDPEMIYSEDYLLSSKMKCHDQEF